MKLLVALISIFAFCSISKAVIHADAGPDKTVVANQIVVLDGSASTDAFDGWRPINVSPDHAIKWDYGYAGFQRQGSLIGSIAYPIAGTYTATLTVCDASDNCSSDTTIITVTNVAGCSSEIILLDTNNPTVNMTNLQTEINNSVGTANRCVTLPNGAVFRGTLIIPNRTSATFLTIRSAGSSNLLPNKRVSQSDFANMTFFENQNNGSLNVAAPIIDTPNTSSNPARFYRFIGLYFRKTNPTAEYLGLAMISLGKNNETSPTQWVNNIIVDRCVIDGSNTTANSWRGVMFTGTDLSLINSYIAGFKGVALETQALLITDGERFNIYNNFLEGASENSLIGGLDISVINHLPSYLSFRRNYYKKNLAWCAVCGQYGGVDYSVKNIWESKVGRFIEVEGNIFENHWLEDQNNAIVITVRNTGIAQRNTWATIQFLDFSYNKVKNFGEGVQILGSDDLAPSQRIDHITIRNIVFSGASRWNGRNLMFLLSSGTGTTGADRISIRKTTTDAQGFDGQGRWVEFNSNTGFTNCNFDGNIGQGFINFGPQLGDSALQQACSTNSYSAQKNGFYLPSGVNPTNNTIVSTRADAKFIDITNGNLKLANDSPFISTGLASSPSGADIDKVNQMTIGVESGIWPTQCNWHTNPACN